MPPYKLEQLQKKVPEIIEDYNARAPLDERITKASLFGSYAEGTATASSDIDLLISFQSAIVSLFTLAKVLQKLEDDLQAEVDVVQDPLPKGSLLEIKAVIPLYESER